MNLPNYFLADLPQAAGLSSAMMQEACLTLKRNRAQYLSARSTENIMATLAELGECWLDPDYPFRRLALREGPGATGFSAPVLEAGIDGFFARLTFEEMQSLVLQEFGHRDRLDHFVDDPGEFNGRKQAVVCSPELLVHIAPGNLPNPAFAAMVFGLLLRSAQFVKCATGSAFLPRLFAHSIYHLEPKLGACLEVAEWRGGREDVESPLFELADCVTATGTDETLAALRKRIPPATRFVGYGHRVSFGYVTRERLSGVQARKTTAAAAADVVAWDQSGCLSPHDFYVENGTGTTPEEFAELLAGELARRESTHPRGVISAEQAAAIASRRALYDIRAAASDETRMWQSADSTAWTVVYESDPHFQTSCLNRFVYVKPVSDPAGALQAAEKVRGSVSCVGLAAPASRSREIALEFARWGVSRVCPLGQMQNPPLAWRHDGRSALGDLVIWADWERE
jgi:hypothetical protein